MVGKMGGEAMSHLNSSSGSVEPALYYAGQKRPGEDGGKLDLFYQVFQCLMVHEEEVRNRIVLVQRMEDPI